MHVYFGLLWRRQGLSVEGFRRHWLEVHGPIVARLPGLRSYEQDQVLERVLTDTVVGAPDRHHPLAQLDGIAKLGFDSRQAAAAALASPSARALEQDEARFLASMRVLATEEYVVIAPPAHAGLFKRVSILTRHAGISAAEFVSEWHGRHADLVRALPGCRGYVQNLVTARFVGPREPGGYEQLPYDGIAELYFDNETVMRTAYASPPRDALRAHARSLLQEIVTVVVQVQRVV